MRNRSEFRAQSSIKADIKRWMKQISVKEENLFTLVTSLSGKLTSDNKETKTDLPTHIEETQDLFLKIIEGVYNLEQIILEVGGCTLLEDLETVQTALDLASSANSIVENLQNVFEAYSKLKWKYLKQNGENLGLEPPSKQEVFTLLDKLDRLLLQGKNSFKKLLDDLSDVYESSEDLLDKGIA
ncbi:MAG: hypothetical protein ACFFC7_17915 [Candidatus Hermodarchaeota archaeon]